MSKVFLRKFIGRQNLNLTRRVAEEAATIGHLKSCFLYKRKPGHTGASPHDQFSGQRPPSCAPKQRFQCCPLFTIAFKITKSLRMHATRDTLAGLPAFLSR